MQSQSNSGNFYIHSNVAIHELSRKNLLLDNFNFNDRALVSFFFFLVVLFCAPLLCSKRAILLEFEKNNEKNFIANIRISLAKNKNRYFKNYSLVSIRLLIYFDRTR